MNKKCITTFFLILKITKSNKEKKNWLNLNGKSITTLILVLELTKNQAEKKMASFEWKNSSHVLFNCENDKEKHK